MSLWADYIREREGHEVIEEPWGFVEYSIAAPVCAIHSIYVAPEYRQRGSASDLANRVTRVAKLAGCTTLWAQVWTGALNSTESLKAILAYGFQLNSVSGDCIILLKSIGD